MVTQIRKSKINFLVAACVVSLAFFGLYYLNVFSTSNLNISQHKDGYGARQNKSRIQKNSIPNPKPSLEKEERLQEEIEPNISEILRWERERFGHHYTALLPSDYDNYDLKNLLLLSQQKDLKALDALANRYRESGDVKSAIKVYRQAAVLGSTPALVHLGAMTMPENATSHSKLINELAFLKVALMRGDQSVMPIAKIKLIKYGLQLEALDKIEIEKRAKAIYRELETERLVIGLAAFDNTVPSYIEKHYSRSNSKLFLDGENPFQ